MSASGPLWVALHNSGQIVQLNESTGQVLRTVQVGTEGASGAGEVIPVGRDVWVVSTDDESIVGVDARTGEIRRRVELGRRACEQAAEAAGSIWVCLQDGQGEQPLIRRLDPATGSLGPAYRFVTGPGSAVVVGDETWLPTTGGLVGVETRSGTPDRFLRIDVPDFVAGYAIKAFGAVWVVGRDGQVVRLDPADLR
jgi:DNA-binding beta-propeller fold protein YncE